MSTIDTQEEAPDLKILVTWAVYEPEETLDKCDVLAGQFSNKPVVLALAKNIIAFTVVMTDEVAKNRLIGIFEKIIARVDGWNAEEKKWFSEKASQACASAHQMCAAHSSGVPLSLREISAAIDRHTAKIRNEVILFPELSAPAAHCTRPDYNIRFSPRGQGPADVINIAAGSRIRRYAP